ncbi:MAG: hypothetical protein AAGG11_17905 [Pseudomonadota bacterium]
MRVTLNTLLVVFSIALQPGCGAYFADGPRLDPDGDSMITDLAEPLIYARGRGGSAPMPAHFILLVPSTADGAAAGGARLWLACGSNLDGRHLVQDPCTPAALELVFGGKRMRFDELGWNPPAPERRWVRGVAVRAATSVPIAAEVLEQIAAAPTLAVSWIGALEVSEPLRLWHGDRTGWTQRDTAAGLRFRARVLPEQRQR